MRRVAILLFSFYGLAIGITSNAQGDETPCLTTLSQAEAEFAAGHFYGIPSLLKECIDNGRFSNEQKVRVYMLLTQVYLLIDDPVMAEKSYLSLLTADPEFIADEKVDPIDVVYLSKKFTTTAIFTPHFKAGANMTKEAIIYELSSTSNPNGVQRVNKMQPGYTLGGGIEWNINSNLGIGGELLFTHKAFQSTTSGIFKEDNQRIKEKQKWLDIPFYVRYGDHIGKFRPYGYAGYAINLRLGAKVEQEYRDVIPGGDGETENPTVGPDTDIRYKRAFIGRAIVLGAGIKYKIGKNFILIDARVMPGLSNVALEKENYYDSDDRVKLGEGLSRYSSVGDLFRIDNFSFSIGYVKPLYDPRKIKKVNTKSVFRKLFKDRNQ